MTDTPTAERAHAAASAAADESKHVAGVAQDEAGKVASEATAQVRSLAGEATTQVTEQVADQTKQQRDKLVGTLGTLGDDLDQMAGRSDGGLAADVAREVAGHARTVTSYLDGREPGELLDDVRDFARRKPGTFLLGALVAGVVAGRLARGVKDAGGSPAASPTPDAATAPTPVAVEPPAYDPQAVEPAPYPTAPAAEPVSYPPAPAPQPFAPPAGDPLSDVGLPASPPPPGTGPYPGSTP